MLANCESFVSGGRYRGLYLYRKQPTAQGAHTVAMYIWEMLYGWVQKQEPEECQRYPGYDFKMGMRSEGAALKLEIYWNGFRFGRVDAYCYGYGYQDERYCNSSE